MKKNGGVYLFIFVFVCLFYSCATVKKTERSENAEEISKTEVTPNTEESKNGIKQTERESAASPLASDGSGVASAVPPAAPLIEQPSLEIIIPVYDDETVMPASEPETMQTVNEEKKIPEKKNNPAPVQPKPADAPQPAKGNTKKPVEENEKTALAFSEKTEQPKSSELPQSRPPEEDKNQYSPNEPQTAFKEESNSNDDTPDTIKEYPDTKISPEPNAQVFSEFPSTEPEESKRNKISRSVKLYVGQKLEVAYPGEGWIYLGETTAQKGLKYGQRKLQGGVSVFHFNAENAGNYILNFSYFDVFSDEFISDALAVAVEPPKEKLSNTVKAPDYKGAVITKEGSKNPEVQTNEAAVAISNNAGTEEAKTGTIYNLPELAVPADKSMLKNKESESPATVLEKIKGFIAEGNASQALETLEDFFKNHTERLDEGWFLRGQAYELNGKDKNIKSALKSYRTLTEVYPESAFWNQADARVRYIKKFYVNVD